MTKEKQERIKRFMNDERTSAYVRECLTDSFLKPSKEKDVYFLAASRIAIDLLTDAWKDMEKYRDVEEKEVKSQGNIAL